ncbi:hypothetical protein E8L99_18775 [Phreatobacter aquaticus]|uniref:DUF1190 domain-containing protein n=1 Tax=Phreatobacter aquaticus TaxID=2570229 RepID=A0A4D7QQY4_9HYPH|nr:hypothetical protein [Phreatobacter aquaticus]QCK87654.1 hypothetical protein E8L99_18775 [Phreatobacter aquaticus]
MSSSSPGPARKRSVLLSPMGIGAMALVGCGTFAATNGFGLGQRNCQPVGQIVTSVDQCERLMPGPTCRAAFTSGVSALGLTRSSSSGTWTHEHVRQGTDGRYMTLAGSPFRTGSSCSSSSSRSGSSWGYFGGYGGSSNSASSQGQSSVSRGGFGTTASSFSSHSSSS